MGTREQVSLGHLAKALLNVWSSMATLIQVAAGGAEKAFRTPGVLSRHLCLGFHQGQTQAVELGSCVSSKPSTPG